MKVLVTGGAGFIGSNLVDKLVMKNFEICIVDNLSTGRIDHVNPLVKFYNLDINSPILEEVFRCFRPDCVVHLAAQVDVSRSIKEPIFDQETNIRGTINILENCVKYDVKKIIYSSSAAIYGIPSTKKVQENHPTRPISFYGISKLVAEYYIGVYSQLYGIEYSILRYSNVFGPRQNHKGEAGVISIFINNAIRNKDLVIYGDGTQTRDFLYVDDVVNANIAAINSNKNGTYNISTCTSVSLNELVSSISSQINKPLNIIYRESRPGDIKSSCLDNNLAINDLNWKPSNRFDKGIKNTIEYYASTELEIYK